MPKYIKFELIEKKPKTKVFAVVNKTNNIIIGVIKWYPSWRKYCYFPLESTIYDSGCLSDINNFIKKLMNQRKAKSIKRKK